MCPTVRVLQTHSVSVICDLEGTLVDFEMCHFVSFERALGDEGVAITERKIATLPGAVGGGDPFIAQTLAEKYELSAENILKQKQKHFAHMLEEHSMTPRVGAIEFLTRLREAGVPLALASLTPREWGEVILRRSGLSHFFPRTHVLFREDVENPKPHPEVYELASRRLGAPAIVFEDSPTGIRAAKAAGLCAIAVPPPFFHEEAHHLRALEVAGADAIYLHWTDIPLSSFLPALAKSGT